MREILLAHAARYPAMEPQDCVKLLYQSEFGGGHLIDDRASAGCYLLREYARTIQRPDAVLAEAIGGGLCRVYLAALDARGIAPRTLLDWFCDSAAAVRGDRAAFLQKLELLRSLTAEGAFGFGSAALEAYLAPYIAAGCPSLRHSEAYRQAYCPAYRVVRRDCCGGAL